MKIGKFSAWCCHVAISVPFVLAPTYSLADDVQLTTPYGSALIDVLGDFADPKACLSDHPDAATCHNFSNRQGSSHDANKALVTAWYARQMCDRFNDIPACIQDVVTTIRFIATTPYQLQDVLSLGIAHCNPVTDSPDQVGITMGRACANLGQYLARHGQERLGDTLEVNGCMADGSIFGFSDSGSCAEEGEPTERQEREAAAQQAINDNAARAAAQRAADQAAQLAAVNQARANGETWLDCTANAAVGSDSNRETYLFKDKSLSAFGQGALYPLGVTLQANFIYFDEVYVGSSLVWHKVIDRTTLDYTVTHDASYALTNSDGSYVYSAPGVIAVQMYTEQLKGVCVLIGAQALKKNVF